MAGKEELLKSTPAFAKRLFSRGTEAEAEVAGSASPDNEDNERSETLG